MEDRFESGAYNWHGIGEIELPVEWTEFSWRQEKEYDKRPEVKVQRWTLPDGKEHTALKVFTTYAQHRYQVGRQLNARQGATYTFKASVWCWSSAIDDPGNSVRGAYHTRIGVRQKDQINWSDSIKAMDRWIEHEITFVATGDKVEIVLQGDAEWAVKHNDAYWDWITFDRIDKGLEQRVADLERRQRETVEWLRNAPMQEMTSWTDFR